MPKTATLTREWLDRADIVDPNFPMAGAEVWHPHGWRLANGILNAASAGLKSHGYEEIALPTLIPFETFEAQSDRIRDFMHRLYLTTLAEGDFVIKPTIEAQASVFLSAEADFITPRRLFSRRALARFESGKLAPLWKNRLIWPFLESHATVAPEAADREVDDLMSFTEGLADEISLPIVTVERLSVEGARHLGYADRRVEAVHVRRDGTTTVVTNIYDLGTRFSTTFGVKDTDGRSPSMVVFGMASRAILALLEFLAGCDEWRFPPAVSAPFAAVIVPRRHAEDDARRAADVAANVGAQVIQAASVGEGIETARARGCGVAILLGPSDRDAVKVVRVGTDDSVSVTAAALPQAIEAAGSALATATGRAARAYHDQLLALSREIGDVRHVLHERSAAITGMCDKATCIQTLGSTAAELQADIIGRISGTRHHQAAKKCAVCGQSATQDALVSRRVQQEK